MRQLPALLPLTGRHLARALELSADNRCSRTLPLALSAAPRGSTCDGAAGPEGDLCHRVAGGARRGNPRGRDGGARRPGPGPKGVLVRSKMTACSTGVVAGMRGSPVYLDGKALGALAIGWAWAREPARHRDAVRHDARYLPRPPRPTTQGPRWRNWPPCRRTTDPWRSWPQLPSRRYLPPQLLAVSG